MTLGPQSDHIISDRTVTAIKDEGARRRRVVVTHRARSV